jgi:hypothetical protein
MEIGAHFPEVFWEIRAYFPEVVKMAMLQKSQTGGPSQGWCGRYACTGELYLLILYQ